MHTSHLSWLLDRLFFCFMIAGKEKKGWFVNSTSLFDFITDSSSEMKKTMVDYSIYPIHFLHMQIDNIIIL